MKQVVKTKRLVITPATEQEMQALIDNEENADVRAAYMQMQAGAKNDPKNANFYLPWVIRKKKEDAIMGDLGFKGPAVRGAVEIGYGMKPEYRGRGYMTEAVDAMSMWAMGQQDVYFVDAQTEPQNAASQAILEKNGFQQTGPSAEGIGFRKESAPVSYMALYMCLGLSCGMSIGISMGQMSIGMCMGMALGMLLGTSLDASQKKRREAIINGEKPE